MTTPDPEPIIIPAPPVKQPRAPVEPKTQAAGLGASVAAALVYILQTYALKGNLPQGAEALIYTAVPGAVAWAAAYLAPHQARPADP